MTLVLDNARYCLVAPWYEISLNGSTSELLFLLAYFPNLNLIERVWKFVKRQC
ncbi:MAG: transposase [Methylococcales bacterium]